MDEREQVKNRVDELSLTGVRLVARLVDSLLSPPAVQAMPSWITENPGWLEHFGFSLATHYVLTATPLVGGSFESAFREACSAMGWQLSQPGKATERFVDVIVTAHDQRERKLSLKSTAAQRLSEKTIYISKLTEGAWIQDARSAKIRRDKTIDLFKEYRKAVDSIFMLRAFRQKVGAQPHRYQLVEIPSKIFQAISDLPTEAFRSEGPIIDCPYGGYPVAAKVVLDRSDAKITIKQIRLEVCRIHVEWSFV